MRPPPEIYDILLRLEMEGICWSHIMLNGGLVRFPFQIHSDLSVLIDYLENQGPTPQLQTHVASRFWNHLQIIVTRKLTTPPPLPTPATEDDAILKQHLTQNSNASLPYSSAAFWGEVARRFINLHRPFNNEPITVPRASLGEFKRVMLLYDTMCQTRGQLYEPFSMHLIPCDEYVNAVHWQSERLLDTFMKDQPEHPLSQSVQKLFHRTLREILDGIHPTALLNSCPTLRTFLHNIQNIHASIRQVPHQNTPPKLIDVFQRLLALNHLDSLWQHEIAAPILPETSEPTGVDLLWLTEQLRRAERQNAILWKHISTDNVNEIKCVPKPRERICPDFCAKSNADAKCPNVQEAGPLQISLR